MTEEKGIPIRNIYHMLAYAFQELNQNNYEDIARERFDAIGDLLAEILYRGVSLQLKQGLHRTYAERRETLSTPRGRFDVGASIRCSMERRPLLVCQYDELSEQNLFNGILKSTMQLLVRCRELQKKRRTQLRTLLPFFCNIEEEELQRIKWSGLRFRRSNRSYRMLMNICRFIAEGMLPTTENGPYRMPTFTDEHMNRLFERFVLNYYKREHPGLRSNPDTIAWDLEPERSPEIDFLPAMRSDITLRKDGRTLVIDTKYYGETLQNHYGHQSVHSANLYQIFTYVKNEDSEHRGAVTGLLLYARTRERIAPVLDAVIGGNRILVRTLDLCQEFASIRRQLDRIVEEIFA